jgi:thioester reductase-like protein
VNRWLSEPLAMATTVFLTGFPGFLGTALVDRLLGRYPAEVTITCLVQPKYRSQAETRRDELEAEHGGDGRIELVEGDLVEPDLGLGAVHADVQDDIREVYHLAAVYDLTVSREVATAVNIEGTRHVLELAAGADDIERLHYVSTIGVAGLYEGQFTEEMLQESQTFGNHYESSKHMAEVLVRQRRDDIPTTIYRPAPVVGDSQTGETQKYDGPYTFLDYLSIQGDNAILPVPRGAGDAEFQVVPRDYIVDAIAYLSRIDESEGEVYHLVDPDPTTTVEMVEAFGDALGKSRTLTLPYPKGIAKGLLESLAPEHELYRGGALEYQTWGASFDCPNTLRDLDGSGIDPPSFTEYVDTLVDFYQRNPDIDGEGMN